MVKRSKGWERRRSGALGVPGEGGTLSRPHRLPVGRGCGWRRAVSGSRRSASRATASQPSASLKSPSETASANAIAIFSSLRSRRISRCIGGGSAILDPSALRPQAQGRLTTA
jgi:hypothetical protein